jgi:nucleoside-diphosphate-sugar epimerase
MTQETSDSRSKQIEQLEAQLSAPYPEDIAFAKDLEGDIMILGAGGKMGPTLTQRIYRALEEAGTDAAVYAVSRFSNPAKRERLEAIGAETIAADLLNEDELGALPACRNIIYMVGMKFGASGKKALTWAMNTYLPGRVAEHFPDSRIVAFSTGNVYPFVPVDSGGCTEDDPTGPVGEYAQSCLGRERIFQHFSVANDTPVCLLRLNYAVEPRYGVLLDIAERVYNDEPVSLDTAYFNAIWQGDANSYCFRALDLCDSPADILNMTGPEVLSVREVAREFGKRFGKEISFTGEERETALLNDSSRAHELFGKPRVSIDEAIDRVAQWMEGGGPLLDKPTKFQVRDGSF